MLFDPALWELYESGPPDEEVSAILRLAEGAPPPPGVRVVSRFGPEIVTVRLPRQDIPPVWESEAVVSLKAARPVHEPRMAEELEPLAEYEVDADGAVEALPAAPPLPSLPEDGSGVVVGICDWGLDFTHPNFRNPDGSTRLLALWDQRGHGDPRAPEPWRYGRLHTRADLNAALASDDPFGALEYHPADADPGEVGSHGTHVADIVAGNRREPGSVVGLASGADLVFVHLASQRLRDLQNLGDSVTLLEGLDFCRRTAAGRPCVLHLSAGKTAGPHIGSTLLERAIDAMLLGEAGIALVQSVGNYGASAMHTHARLGPDQRHVLHWIIPGGDRTPNELEVWYAGQDVFDVELTAPGGQRFTVELGERLRLGDRLEHWGNLYHRRHEPNSGLNNIEVVLHPSAPAGTWSLGLHGREVVDGRLHAWIERDVAGRFQSRFPRSEATSRFTTNTICNCFRAIAVGAYDARRPSRPATRFTSRGPTADGRQKPEIAAPGQAIRAARSTPRRGWWPGEPRLCVKSGTSMAAPYVSGAVALMFQAAGRPLTIHEVRRLLIGTAVRGAGPEGRSSTRLGYGYLDVGAAVAAARRLRDERPAPAAVLPPDPGEADEGGWAPVWAEAAAPGDVRHEVAGEAEQVLV
ncbi:MAG TPA: S8 family serine peptidase [Anaeromyxobacter sp.]|nr:S8 family serine peptidase [Anaeromyxobacter sp.]